MKFTLETIAEEKEIMIDRLFTIIEGTIDLDTSSYDNDSKMELLEKLSGLLGFVRCIETTHY